MKKIEVKDGQQFNQLTVIRECKHRRKDGQRRFWCVCECGKHRYVALQNLVGGRTGRRGKLSPRGEQLLGQTGGISCVRRTDRAPRDVLGGHEPAAGLSHEKAG